MNFKTTLVLVVLLAIVGAYVFFIARDATPTYELEEAERAAGTRQGEPLFAEGELKADGVTRVSIERGKESAAFEKVDGEWRQVEPATFPADDTKLDGLVRSAAELRYVDRVKAGESNQPAKADLSLDPARATVTLAAGEKRHTIAVGRKSTGGRGYVALGESGDVYVVNDALQSVLFTTESLASWRKKSLGAPSANELDAIAIASGVNGLTATKRDGRWYLGEGTGERASESAIADLVRSLGYLSALVFVSDEPDAIASFGLAEPRTTVTLRQSPSGDGEAPRVSTLRVGNAGDAKEESVYATWTQGDEGATPSTVVFTVAKASVDRLIKSPDDLRDKTLVAVANAADVVSVQVTPVSGEGVQLQRDGGAWDFSEPGPGFSADTAAANELVETLLTAEAERFEPAPPPEAQPAATVSLKVAGREQPEVVKLYPASGEAEATNWLAVREGERVAAVLPKERLARVLAPPIALRDKKVLEWQPDAASAATLEQPGGPAHRFTKSGGEWSLEGAGRFESAELERLLGEVSRLRAESWVTDGQTPGESPATLSLQLPEGARTLRVDPATRVAQLDGVDAAFVVTPAVVDLLTQEYRDRTLIELPIEQIRRVTLTRGGQTVTITRESGERYKIEGAEGEGDQSLAAATFDTLAGLRVGRWLDTPRRDKSAIGMVGVELTPESGEPRKLTLFTTDDAGVLGEGEAARWFVLDDVDVARIVSPIVPEEAEKASPIDPEFEK